MRLPANQLNNQRTGRFVGLLVFTALFLLVSHAHAAGSSNIDSTHKYAWSNIGGYVNFGATNGGVTVSSSGLSGYAWSANDGWINLAPTQGGVHNDGTGVLSGFAWDETAGYVNFSGVTIDSSGKFHGSAVGGTVGTTSYAINFDCANCGVVTTWRPVATTTQNQNTVTPVTSGVRSGQSVSVTIPTNAVSSGIAAANAAAQKTVGTILDTTKSLLDSLTQITVTATSSAATSSPTTTSPSLEARLLSALEELLSLIPQIFARILPK